MELHQGLWKVYVYVYDSILLRFHPYLALLGQVKEALRAQDSWRLLDAGCGTGNLINTMVKSQPGVSIVGVDFEKAMLARARAKLGINEKATLLERNLDNPLPFADGEFDGIVCVNALYAVANPSQFMMECGRVLKTNGKLVLVTPPDQPKMGPIFMEHLETLRHMYPQIWFFFLCGQILWLSPSLLLFLLINRIIQGQNSFTFFSEKELSSLVSRCGFLVKKVSKTYGGQAWFLVCTKLKTAVTGTAGEREIT